MSLLNVNKVTKSYGYGPLLNDVSFNLNAGEKISIVGPNGCGKSTLIKIIAGDEKCDSGSVSIKKGAKLVYLKQVSDANDDRLSYDYLKDAFSEVKELEKQIEKYEQLMNEKKGQEEYNKIVIKYCDLIDKFNGIGGYDIDAKINEVCEGLHISAEILNQPFSRLSGGEKTLIQLAKCLLQQPDIFLLDEPTNHLDIERIEWLEDYIKDFKGAIVIVSHDRYFLDKMSDKILDLSEPEAKVYNMNYSNFLKEKEKEFEKQMADFKVQQQQIKKLEQEISYFIQKANQTKSPVMYDRAKQLREKVQKIKDYGVKKPKVQKKINISFSVEDKRSSTVIKVDNLTVKKPNGTYILNNVKTTISYGDRVSLIGANGSGKSTFINTILGIEKLLYSGNITIGPSTKIGYLPQIILFDNPKMKMLDYFQNETSKDQEECRRILSKFYFFQDSVMKRLGSLSEGEKIRLKLAILLQQSVNCLIFDEPTNHIDIDTREVLEDAIESFDGTFIFVSHDRYFINKFANKLFEFEDAKITLYHGNYDYYKEHKQ